MPVELSPRLKDAFVNPAVPALQVGSVLGASGLAASAVMSKSGALALAVGVQCFWLGSSTFYIRHALLVASQQPRTRGLELGCSGLAGTVSGALSGLFNRNASIMRPALLAGALSTAAQALVHSYRDVQRQSSAESSSSSKRSLVDRIAAFLPLRTLTDGQYEGMLQDKLGKIDVEIAMLDDQIAALKLKQREAKRQLGQGE